MTYISLRRRKTTGRLPLSLCDFREKHYVQARSYPVTQLNPIDFCEDHALYGFRQKSSFFLFLLLFLFFLYRGDFVQ